MWRRNRILGESAYFKKWHYVKYCCQLIKHATKHDLTFGLPFDATHEMRVPETGDRTPRYESVKVDGYSRVELQEMQKTFTLEKSA